MFQPLLPKTGNRNLGRKKKNKNTFGKTGKTGKMSGNFWATDINIVSWKHLHSAALQAIQEREAVSLEALPGRGSVFVLNLKPLKTRMPRHK